MPDFRSRHQSLSAAVWLPVLAIWLALGAGPDFGRSCAGQTSSPAQQVADDRDVSADGQETTADPDVLELAEEPLESLVQKEVLVPALDMRVSTVSRTQSTVGRSPAAVYVVTNEMIRRSGARSIPELLRLVPGVNVAHDNANRRAVSIRGFNSTFANKLLVQIDGRSVYTPVFSGVFWDEQDVLLEDIERIEVIRGPGATVWGANAVNGIINIITKRACKTQGIFLQGGGGTEERGFAAFRYGGCTSDSLYWRIYGMGFERDGGFRPGGAGDEWRKAQVGFRMDWEPSECTLLTLQGDYFEDTSGRRFDEALPAPPFIQQGTSMDYEPTGANVLLRLSEELDDDSDWAVQMFYHHDARRTAQGFLEGCNTFDLDFQHRFPLANRHSLIWGFGYRNTQNETQGIYIVSWDPAVRWFDLISYFVQDEITLCDDLLYLTVGSKFEHNDFSGFEYQPTARLLWTPSERQAAWAAISRAVRTPSRVDHDIRVMSWPVAISFAPPGATFVRLEGSPAVESEELLAYEVGFRAQPSDDFSWDLTAFYHDYQNLVVQVPATPFPPAPSLPPAFWSYVYTNDMRAESYGFELAASYQVNPCWRLHGGYSYLKMNLHARPDAASGAENAEGQSPKNQFYFQNTWDFAQDLELDIILRYTDNLPALSIPSYVTMDVRLAWLPTENLEMSIVGRNLLDAQHPEFTAGDFYSSQVQREVYGMATWRY